MPLCRDRTAGLQRHVVPHASVNSTSRQAWVRPRLEFKLNVHANVRAWEREPFGWNEHQWWHGAELGVRSYPTRKDNVSVWRIAGEADAREAGFIACRHDVGQCDSNPLAAVVGTEANVNLSTGGGEHASQGIHADANGTIGFAEHAEQEHHVVTLRLHGIVNRRSDGELDVADLAARGFALGFLEALRVDLDTVDVADALGDLERNKALGRAHVEHRIGRAEVRDEGQISPAVVECVFSGLAASPVEVALVAHDVAPDQSMRAPHEVEFCL